MDLAEKRTEIRSNAGSKQAIYFGTAGRPLFGFYHPPKEGTSRAAGVVLCNPFGTDQTRSERTYRHLAERLAQAGFPCLRFDSFGTGDSGGDEFAPHLLQAWVDDIGAATDELRTRSGVPTVSLVGLRLGATLALLHAAKRGDVDTLVLWSPCVSGAGFVTEVTRLHKVYARIEPHLANAEPPRADGEEALGAFLPRALIEELAEIDLLEGQGDHRPARRALLIDGGNLPGRDALLARLREVGVEAELRTHPGHKFLITVSHRALVPDEVIDSIAGWLEGAYPPTSQPYRSGAGAPVAAPSSERAIVFGEGGALFGILTPAAPAKVRPKGPPIILANAGCVNRSGPHRTYVRMARRWAELGFDVLRVDLSGIGDSPVAEGAPENVPYPPSGLDDLRAAAKALGAERFIIAGLCSGGDYAFQLGAHDSGVVGAWLLNPRTFCVLDLAAVESADGAPPTTSVDQVPHMLRGMVDRGVDTFLVVSRNDPGVAYVDSHAAGDMRSLSSVTSFRRVDFDGADHTFTPVAAQERLSDILTEHLVAKY
jgi:alpha-beta hydrolase superfamily lysophospholipase